jgi:hypothetical protein
MCVFCASLLPAFLLARGKQAISLCDISTEHLQRTIVGKVTYAGWQFNCVQDDVLDRLVRWTNVNIQVHYSVGWNIRQIY